MNSYVVQKVTACLVGIRKGFERKITFKLVMGRNRGLVRVDKQWEQMCKSFEWLWEMLRYSVWMENITVLSKKKNWSWALF